MAYLFAFLSALGYGFHDLFVALGMRRGKATSSQALIINLLAGVMLLVTVSLWFYGTYGYPPLTVLGIIYFMASGLSAPFLGRIFAISSIQRIGPTRSATLRLSDTFFTMSIAVLLLKDPLSLGAALGIILLALGVILIINERKGEQKPDPLAATIDQESTGKTSGLRAILPNLNLGYILGLASAFFFALGGIFRQLGVEQVPSAILGATISTCVAFLTNGLTAYLAGELRGPWNIPPLSAFFFALAGIASTIGMLSFFLALTAGASISITSALKNLSPLVTMFLSWIFLRQFERITGRLVLSLFLVMAGAYLIVS